jgi:la-related protein 1
VPREYFFSVDNLLKDVFLRKYMDNKGFVLLSVVAAFKSIQQLTQDMGVIRSVCKESSVIEIKTGPGGVDRIRCKENWKRWVLARSIRHPPAKDSLTQG